MKTMKTKNAIFGMIAIASISLTSCSESGQKTTTENTAEEKTIEMAPVTINADMSRVIWSGEMLGVKSHEGTLKLTNAEISIKDGKITGGNFTVDMKSITPTDNNFNPEEGSTQEKLIGHLSSDDFFGVENNPTANFVITSVEGNAAMGNLTVKGTTHEEKVENIAITKSGDNVTITGDLVFDRKKYGVAWDSPMKEMILSDDVKVKIELAGN